jgi:uncharacterized membrane protein
VIDEPDDAAGDEEWAQYVAAADEPAAGQPGWLRWAVGAVLVATVVGLIVLWPAGADIDRNALGVLGVPRTFHAAEITAVEGQPCPFQPRVTCIDVSFELVEGPDAGVTFMQTFPDSATIPDFAVGQTAILSAREPDGTVIEGRQEPCVFDPAIECRVLRIRLADEARTVVEAEVAPENPAGDSFAGDELFLDLFEEGQELVVGGVARPTIQSTYQFADFQRRPVLLLSFLVLAAAVVAVGRRKGLLAMGGLIVSGAILLLFVAQGIVAGGSPLPIAIVGAAAIAIVTLYLAHGFNTESSVALLGVVGAVLLTALLAGITLRLANVTGFSSEETSLLTLFEGIQVTGLLLAGVVLGEAGALDDVAVTQAATVREINAANPALGRTELYRRGMRVGRDHIASTINTLFLAYAGASLPLLVLFVLSGQSLGTVANSDVVSIEILRTIVGSLGLLATVPFTTWLAARTAPKIG